MNLILWVEGSSAAIPFGTLVAILALWFGISVPLTFIGAYFGFKKAVSSLFIVKLEVIDWDFLIIALVFLFLCRQLSNQ